MIRQTSTRSVICLCTRKDSGKNTGTDDRVNKDDVVTIESEAKLVEDITLPGRLSLGNTRPDITHDNSIIDDGNIGVDIAELIPSLASYSPSLLTLCRETQTSTRGTCGPQRRESSHPTRSSLLCCCPEPLSRTV